MYHCDAVISGTSCPAFVLPGRMSNTEIKRAGEMIEKLRDLNLPKELQQRIFDTANGMAIAAETFREPYPTEDTRTA